ncbi:universal stress protein [Kitasatospora sp. CMC57]|uniref:Universal stress protein n=1 Tax=Kitasatospora sp. CMC57 TaxID=3231513 RepID=A0AB33KBT4_9ACTN
MCLPVTVGVDGSPASLAAADWAASEAALRDRPLRILHAVPLMPHLLPSRLRQGRAAVLDGTSVLHEAEHAVAVRHPQVCAHTEEIHDLATVALVAAAEDAELLVLAARGDGGFHGLRVGSTTLRVAPRASCPTVVVPSVAAGPAPREEVVVGLHSRRPGAAALDFAFDAARRYRLPLRVLHAFPPELTAPADRRAELRRSESEFARTLLARWTASYPEVRVTVEAEPAAAGSLLVEASQKARLLVLGRRPWDSGGGLGPVAHALLHHTGCPLVLVPET